MVRDTFRLELPSVDIDRDGSGETAVFEIDSYTLIPELRTGLIVGDNPSDIEQITAEAVRQLRTNTVTKYSTFTINEGTGQRTFTLRFTARDGHTTPTWGDPNESSGTAANATGQSAYERMLVMERYISAVAEDSRRPCTIKFGPYDDGDTFDSGSLSENELTVVIENPSFTFDPRDRGESVFTGEMTFIETVDASAIVSARTRFDRDGT